MGAVVGEGVEWRGGGGDNEKINIL